MHDIHLVSAAALSVQERIGQLLGGALAPQVSRKLLLERQLSALALVHDDDLLKTAVASAVNALPVDLLDDLGEDMPGTCCPCVASRISYRGGGGGVVGQQLVKGALATTQNGNCLIDAVLASKEAQGDAVLVGNRRYVRGMQNELRYELVDQLEARAYDLLPPYLQVAVEAKTLAECVSKWNNFSVEEYVQSARRIGYDTRSGGARFNSLDTVMLVVLGVVDGSACVVHCAYSGQYKFQLPGLDTRPTTRILFQAPKCGGSVGHWLGFSGSYTSSAVLPHTPLPPLNGGGLSLDSSSSELPLDWDDAYVAAFDYLDSDDEQPYEPVWSYFELNKVMKHRTRKVCKHRRSGSCVCCVEYDGQLSDSPISPLLSRRHRARKRTPVRHDVGHWPGFSPICTSESAQFPHVPLRGGGDAAIDADSSRRGRPAGGSRDWLLRPRRLVAMRSTFPLLEARFPRVWFCCQFHVPFRLAWVVYPRTRVAGHRFVVYPLEFARSVFRMAVAPGAGMVVQCAARRYLRRRRLARIALQRAARHHLYRPSGRMWLKLMKIWKTRTVEKVAPRRRSPRGRASAVCIAPLRGGGDAALDSDDPSGGASSAAHGRNATLLARLHPLPGDAHLTFDEASYCCSTSNHGPSLAFR